ncbi:MAG: substrate-binding domain-containing protein [Planctomycetota bacterium]
MKSITYYLLLTILLPALISCGTNVDNKEIILATTTSVQDSGLLDVLTDAFRKETGYKIKAIAVGSGEAMALARRGEADVLLVHSPKDEETFMQEGFGKSRATFMYNYFVIVGPPDDPAGCSQTASAKEAFARIAEKQANFISRGDNSGTHKKETALWKETSASPKGKWYIQAGVGMGQTLLIAGEKKAYTLSDKGTYLAFSAEGGKSKLALKIVRDGVPDLKNNYSVIVLNPDKFPKINPAPARRSWVNLAGAQAFADFLVSPATLKLISEYGRDKYGEPLFYLMGK